MWVAALGLYRTRDTKILGAGTSEYKRVAAASGAVFGLLAVGLVAFRVQPASAFYLVSLPLGLTLLPGSRWVARRWYNARQAQGQYLVKAIVIGQAEDVRYVLKRIARKSGAVYEILGVSLPGGRRGRRSTSTAGGFRSSPPRMTSYGRLAGAVRKRSSWPVRSPAATSTSANWAGGWKSTRRNWCWPRP